MKRVLIWVWCFPQMLAGLILKKITRAKKDGDCYKYCIVSGSVSLGEYIFICPNDWDDERIKMHERGHAKQSLYLGWLYLFVIGIPSIVWNRCFEGYRKKHGINYYSFYTERWADYLGGVTYYKG